MVALIGITAFALLGGEEARRRRPRRWRPGPVAHAAAGAARPRPGRPRRSRSPSRPAEPVRRARGGRRRSPSRSRGPRRAEGRRSGRSRRWPRGAGATEPEQAAAAVPAAGRRSRAPRPARPSSPTRPPALTQDVVNRVVRPTGRPSAPASPAPRLGGEARRPSGGAPHHRQHQRHRHLPDARRAGAQLHRDGPVPEERGAADDLPQVQGRSVPARGAAGPHRRTEESAHS